LGSTLQNQLVGGNDTHLEIYVQTISSNVGLLTRTNLTLKIEHLEREPHGPIVEI